MRPHKFLCTQPARWRKSRETYEVSYRKGYEEYDRADKGKEITDNTIKGSFEFKLEAAFLDALQ